METHGVRHTRDGLKQLQSLPLEQKILMTKRRIREWYDHYDGMVYVSFSGGKDSTVLKHIVDSMYDDVPAVFVNTGLEYPEIQRFVREVKDEKYPCFNPDVEIIRPEMRFDEVIKKYGYPVVSKEISQAISESRSFLIKNGRNGGISYQKLRGEYKTPSGNPAPYNYPKYAYLLDAPFKISPNCCVVTKKRPAKQYEKRTGRKPIIATMACESRLRQATWERNGCNAYDAKRATSKPLSFWTEQDILHYIKLYDVPYCPLYGEIRVRLRNGEVEGQINAIDYIGDYSDEDVLETTGLRGTGCVYCLFGCHLEKEPNRIQRLKQTHPRQYEYCVGGGEYVDGVWQPSKDGLGMRKVMEYIGIPYE